LNGTLLESPDPALLAEEISRYLAQPELAEQIGARNREKAWRLWESGAVADRVADHYASLAAEA